tara:strand:- start:268 stop:477 length:210 start_codon:yes stop_codon:yes gene_type:complete
MKIQNEKLFEIADKTLKWLDDNGFKNLVANVTINRDLTVKEIKIKKTLTKKQKKIIVDKFPELSGVEYS